MGRAEDRLLGVWEPGEGEEREERERGWFLYDPRVLEPILMHSI